MVALPVVVQLLASVTVTVYEPAGKPVGSSTVLTCVEPVTQEYVYGDVPPDTVILIEPTSCPGSGQSAVVELIVTDNGVG